MYLWDSSPHKIFSIHWLLRGTEIFSAYFFSLRCKIFSLNYNCEHEHLLTKNTLQRCYFCGRQLYFNHLKYISFFLDRTFWGVCLGSTKSKPRDGINSDVRTWTHFIDILLNLSRWYKQRTQILQPAVQHLDKGLHYIPTVHPIAGCIMTSVEEGLILQVCGRIWGALVRVEAGVSYDVTKLCRRSNIEH